jgi:putative endonuclease
MTNRRFGTLCIGATNDIARRAWNIARGLVAEFTKAYGVKLLVRVEEYQWVQDAIHREKRLDHWKRRGKSR